MAALAHIKDDKCRIHMPRGETREPEWKSDLSQAARKNFDQQITQELIHLMTDALIPMSFFPLADHETLMDLSGQESTTKRKASKQLHNLQEFCFLEHTLQSNLLNRCSIRCDHSLFSLARQQEANPIVMFVGQMLSDCGSITGTKFPIMSPSASSVPDFLLH